MTKRKFKAILLPLLVLAVFTTANVLLTIYWPFWANNGIGGAVGVLGSMPIGCWAVIRAEDA